MGGGAEGAGLIDQDGVSSDEDAGAQGVNLLGVIRESVHAVSHGSEIDNSGNATKSQG